MLEHRLKQAGNTTSAIFIILILILILSVAQQVQAATKRALLIAVKDYTCSGLDPLKGPHNDVRLIKKVLREKFEFREQDITVLMDRQATHTGLEKAFARFAQEVNKGDFVYIHYSGHGSYVQDQDGDERLGDFDQTWVPYGSRCPGMTGRDRCDIRDDELHQWLAAIFKKSGNAVFVSDSCHSGSIPRGKAPTVRAARPAEDECPFETKNLRFYNFKNDFKDVILIGAVQDTDNAYEYTFVQNETYGVFTWFWAQQLQQAQPGDTWGDLFKRVQVNVTDLYNQQRPQLRGNADMSVFGGDFKKYLPRIPVSKVSGNRKKVRINAGKLSGVTVDSIYRLYNPREKDASTLPSLKIVDVKAFYSEAVASGKFSAGDLVVEESHSYNFDPIPVFINADAPHGKDKVVIERLRRLFTGKSPEITGYRLTDNQKESKILLYVLRPKKKNGGFIKESPGHTLPQSFTDQPPRVWGLNNAEGLLSNSLCVDFSDLEKGAEVLADNLIKYSRVKEIKKLSSHKPIDIEFSTTIWLPVEGPGQDSENYLELPNGQGVFKKMATYRPGDMDQIKDFPPDSLLTFSLKNTTGLDFYIYLLEIMDNGKVEAIFPEPGEREQEALLSAGRERDLKDLVVLLLNEVGQETVKLIVTGTPIDISLLNQKSFSSKGGASGKMNPLERLLTTAAYGLRGTRISMRRNQWATTQYSIVVGRKGTGD